MQSAWRVVDCTEMDGSITYKRGRVVIDSRGAVKPVEVSLAQTAVLLIGQKLYCSSAALDNARFFAHFVIRAFRKGTWPVPGTIFSRQT